MEVSTQVPSSKMRSQVMENTFGPTVRPTKVCGKRTKCMVEVYSCGRMVSSTREISKMTSVKAMACSPGEMVVSMMDNGKTASNTDAEYLSRMKVPGEWASGRMAATLNG